MVGERSKYLKAPFSKRQIQCLRYLLRGKSAVYIARMLALSPKTIEYYIDEIKFKMGCATKAEIIEKAIEKGYLMLSDEMMGENFPKKKMKRNST